MFSLFRQFSVKKCFFFLIFLTFSKFLRFFLHIFLRFTPSRPTSPQKKNDSPRVTGPPLSQIIRNKEEIGKNWISDAEWLNLRYLYREMPTMNLEKI